MSLERAIEADGMYDSEDSLASMCANTSAIESTENNRFKVFPQMKVALGYRANVGGMAIF